MPAGIGPWEIVLLLFLAMLLFGAKKLPELGRSVGQGMREFKTSIKDQTDDMRAVTSELRSEVDAVHRSATEATDDLRNELSPRSVYDAEPPRRVHEPDLA
jgi:sec-independent protein translocase protein TatA